MAGGPSMAHLLVECRAGTAPSHGTRCPDRNGTRGLIHPGALGAHRGAMTLSPAELSPSWASYAVVFVAYVALGLWTRSVVLNGIVGPLFPLLALELLPQAARRLRRARTNP